MSFLNIVYNYFWLFLYYYICDPSGFCSAETAANNPLNDNYVTCIAEVQQKFLFLSN